MEKLVQSTNTRSSSRSILFSILFMTFACLLFTFSPKPGHAGQSGTASKAMVAACHPQSTAAGLRILKVGGNAVDAFVAATLVDYVVSPGLTSMAGPLGLLYFDSKHGTVHQLSAEYKTPSSPTGAYAPGEPPGKAILVPGALAGLERFHQRFGKLPWKQVVAPAQDIAKNGFVLDAIYGGILQLREQSLRQSPYARATFFHENGVLLAAGETLRLPEVEESMKNLATYGASYFYTGAWGKKLTQTVRSLGGEMADADLAAYEPRWVQPLLGKYKGLEIYVPGSPVSGGARLLLSLQVLEHYDLPKLGHWSRNDATLAKLIRLSRRVSAEEWLRNPVALADHALIRQKLDGSTALRIFRDLENDPTPALEIENTSANPSTAPPVVHSYHVVVVDEDNNVVTGTNTINSIPFGEPVQFIGGIPLNSSGIAYVGAPPDTFVNLPFTNHIVMSGGAPKYASGVFGSSLYPADFQILSNLLDFGMSPEDAIRSPRFGSYMIDYINHWPPKVDTDRTFIDARFSPQTRSYLQDHGINTESSGGDTGFGVVIEIDRAHGRLRGMTPELLGGVAAGE